MCKSGPAADQVDLIETNFVPLDAAAYDDHSNVVRELIHHVGIKGCGGESGGVASLNGAARRQHVDIMTMLTSAGVIDTGDALFGAAGFGQEAAVKFLLQQRELEGSMVGLVGYVDAADPQGTAPLMRSINFFNNNNEGVPELISSKVWCGCSSTPGRARHWPFASRARRVRCCSTTHG